MTDAEQIESLLATEDWILITDKEFYLDCMNNKPLRDRHTPREIRDGLILYHHIYRSIRDAK